MFQLRQLDHRSNSFPEKSSFFPAEFIPHANSIYLLQRWIIPPSHFIFHPNRISIFTSPSRFLLNFLSRVYSMAVLISPRSHPPLSTPLWTSQLDEITREQSLIFLQFHSAADPPVIRPEWSDPSWAILLARSFIKMTLIFVYAERCRQFRGSEIYFAGQDYTEIFKVPLYIVPDIFLTPTFSVLAWKKTDFQA